MAEHWFKCFCSILTTFGLALLISMMLSKGMEASCSLVSWPTLHICTSWLTVSLFAVVLAVVLRGGRGGAGAAFAVIM